jgi:tripartite-type tricarboxylate transporter receptor subunit TctC
MPGLAATSLSSPPPGGGRSPREARRQGVAALQQTRRCCRPTRLASLLLATLPLQGRVKSTAIAVLLFVSLLLIAPLASRAQDIASFYSGKTITIIVGLPPGGAADAYARLVQRHLSAHLPGAPSIVVQNVPGAGTLKSVLYMESLPADGAAIVTFSSGLLTEAINSPAHVNVDFRKQGWIGNVSEDARVCYVWHTTGIRNWPDLLKRRQVVFAASAPGTAGYVDAAMLRELFGVHLQQINGYPGSAEMRLAVEKGEVDGSCGGWTATPEDWLRDGKIDVVVRLSPTLLPGMDKRVPFAGDLARNESDRAIFNFLMAPEKLGRLFMVSGAVPAERVAALRRAFDATVADPAFRRDAEQLRLTVAPMSGETVAREVAALYATPPDLVAKAKVIAGE